MSIIMCSRCPAWEDTDESNEFVYLNDSNTTICPDCYDASPERCERQFDGFNDCICGQHRVLPPEPDVGINTYYLELK